MATIVIHGNQSEDPATRLSGSGKDVRLTGAAGAAFRDQRFGDEDIVIAHGSQGSANLDLTDVYNIAGSLDRGEIVGRVAPDHDMVVLDTSQGQGQQFMILELPAATNLSFLKYGEDFTFMYNGGTGPDQTVSAKVHSWTDNAEFAPEVDAFGHSLDFDSYADNLVAQGGFKSARVSYVGTDTRAVALPLATAQDFHAIGPAVQSQGIPLFFDELLLQGADGKFYHVLMPVSADPVQATTDITLNLVDAGEATSAIQGKAYIGTVGEQRFLSYTSGENLVFEGAMNVGGMSAEGAIRRVESREDIGRFYSMAKPFDEIFLIKSVEGHLYVVTLDAGFQTEYKDWGHLRPWKDVRLDRLDITYNTTRPDGSFATALLSGSIDAVSKIEVDDKTPVNVTGFARQIVDATGMPISPGQVNQHDADWLNYVLQHDNPFLKGHETDGEGRGEFINKISFDKFQTKKKALVNKLERIFFDVEVTAETNLSDPAAAPIVQKLQQIQIQIGQRANVVHQQHLDPAYDTQLIALQKQYADTRATLPVIIQVKVMTPPRLFTFGAPGADPADQMAAMVDPFLFGDAETAYDERLKLRDAWAQNENVRQGLRELQKQLSNEIPIPIDHDGWELALRRFARVSRKNQDFEVVEAGIRGVDARGQAMLDLQIRPKPKDFSITFVDARGQTKTWTMKDVGMDPDKPIGDTKLGIFNNYAKKAKEFYDKVSEKLAAQKQIFTVLVPEANGRPAHMEPYVPKIRAGLGMTSNRTPDVMRGSIGADFKNLFFAVDEKGQPLQIQTMKMPHKLDVSGLPDDMQPKAGRLERLFNDKHRGYYTSESIFHGIAALTRWYTAKGYPLRGGHLDYEITEDGTLKIKADLYKVTGKVDILVPDVNRDFIASLDRKIQSLTGRISSTSDAAQQAKWKEQLADLQFQRDSLKDQQTVGSDIKRKMENEFAQIGRGDAYNVKKFYRAIQEVQRRYHMFLIPSEVKDEQTGKVTLRVIAIHKEAKDVLNQLNIGAGVAATDAGFGPTAEASFDSQLGRIDGPGTGDLFSAKVGGVMAGGVPGGTASVSVSGPADQFGGHSTFGVSGYTSSTAGSNVGAKWTYRRPVGDSNWSVGPELGVNVPIGSGEGANVPYFRAGVGASYDDMNGLTGGASAGINVGATGFVYGDVSAGVNKRWNLSDDETWYAEAYAKAGVLFGNVPAAQLFGSSPYMGWMGAGAGNGFIQGPISIYAMVGAAIMKELVDDPNFGLDIGVGANAGGNGPIWSVGAGLRFKFRLGPLTVCLTLGPCIVNGVPTLLGISFD